MITIHAAIARHPKLKGLIRDLRPVWVLEEIGARYEIRWLDFAEREHKQPEYLALNPFGRVPTMTDGSRVLFESSAICIYIADKHEKLMPGPGSFERYRALAWISAACTNIEPNASRVFACDVFYPQDDKTAHMRENAAGLLEGNLAAVDRSLADHPYLLGDELSVPDVLMATSLRYLHETELLEPHARLKAYAARCWDRPAFQRAMERNGGPAEAS